MIFLFIAFAAFTNQRDPVAVCINCGLILGAIIGFDQAVVARPEPVKEKLEVSCQQADDMCWILLCSSWPP